MTTWFTSDLHFRHKNICNYTERKVETTSELHDDWLIRIWNSQVKKNDTVWHLGDFCFSASYEVLKSIVVQLNGDIRFIIGNHDKEENFKRLKAEGLITWYGHYKEIKINETKVVLSHFPFAAWHRQHYGSWHLHGHCHAGYQGAGKILDVGLDMSYKLYGQYGFFSEEDIEEFMQIRESFIADGRNTRNTE